MYPSITRAARRLQAERAIIDGEIVALDSEGRPSFQALQHRSSHPGYTIAFYAFDLLEVDGRDLLAVPLIKRRARLSQVLNESGLLLSVELPGSVEDIVETVRAHGLEGVIAKRRNSLYVPGERSSEWLKLKLELQQEFVIGGYRPGSTGIDALIVGYYENRSLRYAGKVRAGFVPHSRREVLSKLKPLHVDACPFVDLPTDGSSHWGGGIDAEEMKAIQWVKPELVAQIRFVEWTAEGRLRHAKFLGLRQDKAAKEISRE